MSDENATFRDLLNEFVGVICREEQAASRSHLTRKSLDVLRKEYDHAEAAVIAYVERRATEARNTADLLEKILYIDHAWRGEEARLFVAINLEIKRLRGAT